MLLRNIKEEQHLREWLAGEIANWNKAGNSRVAYEWIEPSRYGSTSGISDMKLTYRNLTYGIELKHWFKKRDGICYKIRPAQRRYNVMGVNSGQKLLVFGSIAIENKIELVAIRGDKIPLRDYCCIEGSGCELHLDQTKITDLCTQGTEFEYLLRTIDNEMWWPKQCRAGQTSKRA